MKDGQVSWQTGQAERWRESILVAGWVEEAGDDEREEYVHS